jgi:hypothetical protein
MKRATQEPAHCDPVSINIITVRIQDLGKIPAPTNAKAWKFLWCMSAICKEFEK